MFSAIEKQSNSVKFNSTGGKCQKWYRSLQDENTSCQEVNFDSMTEHLQVDYLDR